MEKFCDRYWGIPEDYLSAGGRGVMGYTAFTYQGFAGIVISAALDENSTQTGRHRTRSTLAHEVGHAILHEKLFVEKFLHQRDQGLLFGKIERQQARKIVCRDTHIFGTPNRNEWWEIQANRFMSALLIPRPLFENLVGALLADYQERTATPSTRVNRYYASISMVSECFNVSRQMAGIAVDRFSENASIAPGECAFP